MKDRSQQDPDERWLQESMKVRKVPQRPPKHMADVLSQLISRKGYASVRSASATEDAWAEVVGDDLSRLSRATKVKRGVLQIQVADSMVMQELTFIKPQLVEQLNQKLDKPISDLRFWVGPL